jgi:hypothetical protein
MAQSIELRCPSCRHEIPFEDIGMLADVTLCRSCGRSYCISEITGKSQMSGPELNETPAGMSFETTADGFRIEGTTRSWSALFLIPFTCVWAGGALSGIYGSQIRSGHFSLSTSLVGIPFLIGSAYLIGSSVMAIVGKVVVTQRSGQFTIFTGVGLLGWTRDYEWADFSSVSEEPTRFWGRNRSGNSLVLQGKRRVAFGALWNGSRRYFALHALRRMLG